MQFITILQTDRILRFHIYEIIKIL